MVGNVLVFCGSHLRIVLVHHSCGPSWWYVVVVLSHWSGDVVLVKHCHCLHCQVMIVLHFRLHGQSVMIVCQNKRGGEGCILTWAQLLQCEAHIDAIPASITPPLLPCPSASILTQLSPMHIACCPELSLCSPQSDDDKQQIDWFGYHVAVGDVGPGLSVIMGMEESGYDGLPELWVVVEVLCL